MNEYKQMEPISKFQAVKSVIDSLDIYCLLSSGAPADEFDLESREIAEQINEDDSYEQVARVIAAVINKYFCEHRKPADYYEAAMTIKHLLSEGKIARMKEHNQMEEVTIVGKRPNYGYGWDAYAYDIHIHYGYQTMLMMFDMFIAEYKATVDRVAKAKVSGMNHSVVWRRWLFRKMKPLSEMTELKEECGEVAIGCFPKKIAGLQMYISLANQTSIVYIDVPTQMVSDKIETQLLDIARFFQMTLMSGLNN